MLNRSFSNDRFTEKKNSIHSTAEVTEKNKHRLREIKMIQFVITNNTVFVIGNVILLVIITEIVFLHDGACFEKYFRIGTSKVNII